MSKRVLPFNWPLVIACAMTFLIVGILENAVLRKTGGVFMYPLDDPFIHMQIAKNLAFHGTWGINPGEFASASSSLLYTLLLSCLFKVFSACVGIPFIINCVAAMALLAVLDHWLRERGVGAKGRTWVLLLVIFIVPLPVLIISGMEHTLQCLFTFLFITRLGSWLERSADERRDLPWTLLLYAILTTAVRYEGLFLVGVACLILAYHSRWKAAFLLGFAGVLPVIVFGVYSIAKGSYFLPNSVLVKSESLPFSIGGLISFAGNILVNKWTVVKGVKVPGVPPPGISLLTAQRLIVLLPLTGLLFRKQLREQPVLRIFLLLLTVVTLLHLALAATGWLYRYEAYLILNSIMLLGLLVCQWGQGMGAETRGLERGYAWILAFAVLFPFVLRTAAAYSNIRQACINIYEQQYQMAQFLHQYYDHAAVAANDIGAISYYSDIHTVDLWGLGDIDVARSKKKGYWNASFLDSLVRQRQVKLAIVYDEWFDPALTAKWKKVATWEVSNNVILGGETVSFYAVGEDGAALLEKLRAFQPLLPSDVKVNYQ